MSGGCRVKDDGARSLGGIRVLCLTWRLTGEVLEGVDLAMEPIYQRSLTRRFSAAGLGRLREGCKENPRSRNLGGRPEGANSSSPDQVLAALVTGLTRFTPTAKRPDGPIGAECRTRHGTRG
jgi:hypothetical protein